MRTTRRFLAIFICALLCVPAASAQEAQRDAQSTTISQEVLIIIQPQQVRFTVQKAVQEVRLQVFDQTGKLVYDSGAVTEPELNWPLQTGNGEAAKSGLYAYTLSIKEAGAETAQVRRGHLIVDRAQDRDGKTDRLWITTQSSSGVGAELTVARSEDAIVAGTSASSERSVGQQRGDSKRDASSREVEAETQSNKKAPEAAVTAAAAITVGQIAKFTSATTIGGSGIVEVNGNVGIGTTNPEQALHVNGNIISTGGSAGLQFRDRTQLGYPNWQWYAQDNVARLWHQKLGDLIGITMDGNVGIGTTAPRFGKLDVRAPAGETGSNGIYSEGKEGVYGVSGSASGHGVRGASNSGDGVYGESSGPNGAGGHFVHHAGGLALLVDGKTSTRVLQITGGSDFAENFDVNAPTRLGSQVVQVEPGMVVSIDPANSGRLTLSTQAYDHRVAGIISGAGGVKPGMMMSQEGTLADGKHPVALTGRVYCWADASRGAIEPGDLLTTSVTPGHAMKATDPAKAQGAIIGKAMTELKSGRGLVLVLVTLQ